MEKESASSFWAGIKKFEDILSRNPQAYSFAPLADIYRKLGLLDEAVSIARRGVALHPDFAAGQMALAVACLENNLVDEARRALEVVARVTPENLDAQRRLAGIHAAAGNAAAAERCLRIVADLDPESAAEHAQSAEAMAAPPPPPEAFQQDFAAAEEEDLIDADILELTDDLIEEESYVDESFAPFAAAPERPSLQSAESVTAGSPPPAGPMETAAAASVGEFHTEEPAMALEEAAPQPAVMTATIAELFVSQGLIDRGIEVYRELLRDNPANEAYRARLQELTAPAGSGGAVVETAAESTGSGGVTGTVTEPLAGTRDAVGVLEGWLGNIGRIRECRTESR